MPRPIWGGFLTSVSAQEKTPDPIAEVPEAEGKPGSFLSMPHRLDAQLHSLSVQLNGLVPVALLVLLEGLGDQEVGSLQVDLLLGLQRVAALSLNCGLRSKVNETQRIITTV